MNAGDTPLATMTLAVYRVNARTGKRTYLKRTTVAPTEPPPIMEGLAYPECRCPRCQRARRIA